MGLGSNTPSRYGRCAKTTAATITTIGNDGERTSRTKRDEGVDSAGESDSGEITASPGAASQRVSAMLGAESSSWTPTADGRSSGSRFRFWNYLYYGRERRQ
jgi:hypothetical protein